MAAESKATEVVSKLADLARLSARTLIAASAQERVQALEKIGAEIESSVIEILAANQKDMDAASKSGMQESMQDRLLLTETRIKSIADGARQVSKLPSPLGKTHRCSARAAKWPPARQTSPRPRPK